MTEERKTTIMARLQDSATPISASVLAKELGVTRQVIVGDVALLRASGSSIIATPRGYLLDRRESTRHVISSSHESDRVLEELYIILDCGCGVLDVKITHAVYGEITCELLIFTREEAVNFVNRLKEHDVQPLSAISSNRVHHHTLQCPSEKHFRQVQEMLKARGFQEGCPKA